MSAEQTLQAHWRGVTEAEDAVAISAGLSAFADHLQELWQQAVEEDAEYLRETGGSMPDVLRLNGRLTLRVRYTSSPARVDTTGETPLFEFLLGRARRPALAHRSRSNEFFCFPGMTTQVFHPPPNEWEYDRVAAFVAWVWEFLKPVEVESPPPAA